MKQIFFLLLVLLCGLSLTLNAQQNCAVNIFLLENECGEARLFAYCPEPASENCYTWNTGGSNNAFLNITESGTYSCTAICSNGGEATGTLQITVAPPCNISLDITETKFCGKTKLQATEVAGANYMWSNGAMTSSVEVMNSATYTVTMTVGTSEFISSKNVEVMNFQAPPIIGNNKVCVGEKTTVTASGGVSYLWSNGMIGPTIQVGKGTYTVTVTGSNGCTASVSTQITEYPVSPAPKVTQSVIDGIITLTSTLPSGNLWSNSSTDMTLAPDSEIKPYSLKIKDLNGCYSASSCEMLAGRVVNNLFFCPLQASFAHEVDGKKVKLINTSQGSDQGAIVFWGDSSSDFMADSMMMHEYSSDGIYIVKLVVFMGSEKSEFIGKITINTKTGNDDGANATCPPMVSFMYSIDGMNVHFKNTSSGDGLLNYLWDFGDDANSSEVNPIHKYSQYKDYKVTLHVKTMDGWISASQTIYLVNQGVLNGTVCDSTLIKASNGMKNGEAILPSQISSQTKLVLEHPGARDWSWSPTGQATNWSLAKYNVGKHHFYVSYFVNNQKQCSVFDYEILGGGLTDTDDAENRSSKEDKGDINIYPNPTSGPVEVDLSGLPTGTYLINVQDQTGRQVTKKVIKQ